MTLFDPQDRSEAMVVAVQVEMAPDFMPEPLNVMAWNCHGLVILTRAYGNLQGDGPYENVSSSIFMTSGERLARVEPFATGETSEALARFDEICAALDVQQAL
ncbi:MAG TPA: hypothetical protein VGK20_12590 [Candidatus Binatia bacterium]